MPKVKVEKILNVDRDLLYNKVTDLENLPKLLPNYFESVKIVDVDKANNVIITEEEFQISNRKIKQKTKHVMNPPEKHESFVIEGDAKGSHVVERYEKVPEGTKVIIEGDFKLGGALKVLGFLAKGKISKRINELLDELENKLK
ncbi:MAG: hypothetical protein KatS3mg003_0973 [Candidatus Nitrosocaldaceae archaeon]|nr:MAG: hypothetical protein KatS3mg003_0973 [Candidatus Nitrosocaldaceae archaeon]